MRKSGRFHVIVAVPSPARSLFAAASPLAPAVPAAAAGVASPCVSVCRMDAASGLCEGCLRTIDEIAHWGLYDDDEKRAVIAALPLRRVGSGAR